MCLRSLPTVGDEAIVRLPCLTEFPDAVLEFGSQSPDEMVVLLARILHQGLILLEYPCLTRQGIGETLTLR